MPATKNANAWRTAQSTDAMYTLALDPAQYAHLSTDEFEELVWTTLPSPEAANDDRVYVAEECEALLLIALHKLVVR